MATEPQVHWHEGLFLQPHHLQVMQRQLTHQSASVRRLAFPFSYGVVHAQLSLDALANKQVRFDRLRVIMPSGTDIEFPGNGELAPLSIKDRFDQDSDAFVVNLGVPLWHETRANVVENKGEPPQQGGRPLYSITTTTRPDENTGQNPQLVALRHFNARLFLDGEDTTDLEFLPLLRVVHASKDQEDIPSEDRNFIPPCLIIGGSRNLHDRLVALTNQVSSWRGELVSQLQRSGTSPRSLRAEEIERVLRLQTLNRFTSTMEHLFQLDWTTPSQAYIVLRELLGELAALATPRDDPFAVPEYDHDHLQVPFSELFRIIPELGLGPRPTDWLGRPFIKQDHLWVIDLSEEELTKPIEYLLAVKSNHDPHQLNNVIEDGIQFRLDSHKQISSPGNVRGVKLLEERAPAGLPALNNIRYYRLHRADGPPSVMAWERIKKDHKIAIRWGVLPANVFDEIKLYWKTAEGAK